LAKLSRILDALESFHGRQTPRWPTDPYPFLIWWHCGYPASEDRCTRGWESLNAAIGIEPEKLLTTASPKLAKALEPGGMIPELRAKRLKQIAERVQGLGDLRATLTRLPLQKARALLKKFPGIADPGADRMLLFAAIVPIAAVPSSGPQVAVRIESGREGDTYDANYREAQEILTSQIANTFEARTRAYLLLQRHGQEVCKRTGPLCDTCPIAAGCAFFAPARGRRNNPSRGRAAVRRLTRKSPSS
jgi:endonuclease-3 related protein